MSKEYFDCIFNLWTGFVGKATCEAGYLKCDGFSCSMYTPKKNAKPMINYDRLVSKTPEEMAEKLVDYSYCPPGTACKPTCKECWLSWLKAPVEEVDNGRL